VVGKELAEKKECIRLMGKRENLQQVENSLLMESIDRRKTSQNSITGVIMDARGDRQINLKGNKGKRRNTCIKGEVITSCTGV